MAHPPIPGLPKGWTVREFHQGSNPRDAVVLCERDPHKEFDCNFVSWSVNMVEGGCHLGHYFYKYEDALGDYTRRRVRLS